MAPRTPALFCADLAEDPLTAWSDGAWYAPTWLALALRPALADHFAGSEPPHLLLSTALPPARARAVLADLRRSRFPRPATAETPARVAPDALVGAARDFARWLASPTSARLHLRLAGTAPDRPILDTAVTVTRLHRGQRLARIRGAAADALMVRAAFGDGVVGGALAFFEPGGRASLTVPARSNQALVVAGRERAWEVAPVRRGVRYDLTVVFTLG